MHVTKAWKKVDGTEVLVPVDEIETGDQVVVHMGNVIPFDGVVAEGEALVNQASLTGEATAVRKAEGASVYAGTVMEEGTLTITVSKVGSDSKFEKIVKMIEESEKMKSNVEGKAAHLADKLVPYSLGCNSTDIPSDKKCHKGTFHSDGGFLLCTQARNADFRAFCDSRGRQPSYYRKGRQVLRSNGRSRYDRI